MNLIDMVSRKDRNLSFNNLKKHTVINWKNKSIRGFLLQSDKTHILEISSPFKWYPYSEKELSTGWKLIPIGSISKNAIARIELIDSKDQTLLSAENVIQETDSETEIQLPKIPENFDLQTIAKLRLSIKGKAGFLNLRKSKIFLGVHEVLDRKVLIDQCVGKGVELGPGPNPQIKPSSNTEVNYVEQMTPKQWNELYNKEGKYKVDSTLWDFYQIGEAHNIPAEDNSLDFIFSSHVFEHLANPIAHLEHWFRKLKAHGKICAVVPDVGGCKDYVFRPSTFEEIEEEWKSGELLPTMKHYRRWAEFRAPGQDPETFMKSNRSIHCHFYTRNNITKILEYSVSNLGFNRWELFYSQNHKDFYFILEK